MNDPEGFLSRWARRKRDVAKGEEESDDRKADFAPTKTDAIDPERTAGDRSLAQQPVPAVLADEKSDEPLLDLSTLPSIESITAETDIRPFLARGVPAALRQAALRRMWVADPKIRDFVEMAENQWDFTGAGEIPGFNFSPPTGDIKRLVADIFGGKPESESESEAQSDLRQANATVPIDPADQESASRQNVTGTSLANEEGDAAGSAEVRVANETMRQTLVARRNGADIASQKNDAMQDSEIESRRRSHGRAMPK